MTNDQLFIVGMVASFFTGVSGTIFVIRMNYLLKHRPRFTRQDRVRMKALRNATPSVRQ